MFRVACTEIGRNSKSRYFVLYAQGKFFNGFQVKRGYFFSIVVMPPSCKKHMSCREFLFKRVVPDKDKSYRKTVPFKYGIGGKGG
ncbi:hypothetical protein DSECCO2_575810 [anaerobic digester metagenome]